MSQPNPERIHHARRTELRNRLRDERRVSYEAADELVLGWMIEAEARGLQPRDPHYWSEGWAWLVERTSRPGPWRKTICALDRVVGP
jgi:hypothetical protein